jgi:hypothetical protein
MASYNPDMQVGSYNNASSAQNKTLLSKVLRRISNLGMDYDDMLARNTVGVGKFEDPRQVQRNGADMSQESYYSFMSSQAVARILSEKSLAYLDKTYPQKLQIMSEYANKDKIRDLLDIVCDELIIYGNENDFCKPKQLGSEYPKDIVDKYQEFFEKIYNSYGFNSSKSAWQKAREFIVSGYSAAEIIWDDKKRYIIGFNPLDPSSIVPSAEPGIGRIWIQYPDDASLRRIFLDSQIIYVSYASQSDYSTISYVEALIKPYNQLTIMEQTRIMYNQQHATLYKKYTVPIKGLSTAKAKEEIAKMIANYKETVEFDDTMGTLRINGSANIPYTKDIWLPEGEMGTPSFELVSPQGNDLNESDMLTWFRNNLISASKIPHSRFQKDTGGGNMYNDLTQITRDEMKFENFISRIRTAFKELIVKPIRLQMCVEFPELVNDIVFLNQCDIIFNTNQDFVDWVRLDNEKKKLDFIKEALDFKINDTESFFSHEYLVRKYLKMSQEELDENKSYKIKEKKEAQAQAQGGGQMQAQPSDSSSGFGDSFGGDGGSSPDAGFGDFGGETQSAPQAQPQAAPETPAETGGEEEYDF